MGDAVPGTSLPPFLSRLLAATGSWTCASSVPRLYDMYKKGPVGILGRNVSWNVGSNVELPRRRLYGRIGSNQILGVLVEVGRRVVAKRRADHARLAAASRSHIGQVERQQSIEGGRTGGHHESMHLEPDGSDHQNQIGVELRVEHRVRVLGVRTTDNGDLWWRWLGRSKWCLRLRVN